MSDATISDGRIAEYWDWITVALYLLVPVDLLTSLGAAAIFGTAAEANPFMAWLLERSPEVIVGVNLAVVVLAVAFFHLVLLTLHRTPQTYERHFAVGIEAWLGCLVAAGLGVFANNLSVIVYGASLL